jgi:alkylation response protein AidB-like acyl-CoA dehydrogenase
VEYGGRALPYGYQAIALEEIARADASENVGVIGLNMVGPTLIAFGTAEQKARYLPEILSGRTVFCQGFSEPEAGSDLASVRTVAKHEGGTFVVNGHKVWSSYAHLADHCLLLARTDRAADRHRGLTCFLLDMRSAGVQIRPVRQVTGDCGFAEILLDDVRVPSDAVVGDLDDGWRVAMTTLAHERGTFGFTLTCRLERLFTQLLSTVVASGRAGDPIVRDTLAEIYVDLEGLRFTNYRSLAMLTRSGVPGPESSIVKLRWSEATQRLTSLAVELFGAGTPETPELISWREYWRHQQMRSRGDTIAGGTSEVLRNVVAERVLALPRSR